MQIGSGWIYSEFHPQRPIFTQFLEQLLFTDQLGPPLFNLFDDGGRVHSWQLAVGSSGSACVRSLFVQEVSFANNPGTGNVKAELSVTSRSASNWAVRARPTANC
jgi:hypothetical protein